MKKLTDPTTSWREFERRAATLSAELQKSLLAKHASEFLAINVETGEYLLAPTSDDAWKQFRARWPGTLGYVCRVDGGPVAKFHGI
jgi:hypothetical protein